MIVIALAALASAAVGVVAERRSATARVVARRSLQLMLYVLVPFVSYVTIAHLEITVAGAAGLVIGWVAIGLVALVAARIGSRALHLPDAQLGAFIVCAVVANTGYLGNPIIVSLLGAKALRYGVAWDQLVGAPTLFIFGFGIASHYGSGETHWIGRAKRFLLRNPPLWATIAGAIVPPAWAPAPLPSIAHGVVDALLVGGFFAAGVYLSSERREEHAALIEWPDRNLLAGIALRLAVAPVILLAVSSFAIRLPTAYIIQSMMPTGLNTLVVGHAYGLDQRFIASMIIWTSVIVIFGALIIGAI